MHAIGQQEHLSLANGLLLEQMFSQADKLRTVSRGMPGVQKKKKKAYSNLKIENRMPTHRTNIRIIKYSGPALVCACIPLLVNKAQGMRALRQQHHMHTLWYSHE